MIASKSSNSYIRNFHLFFPHRVCYGYEVMSTNESPYYHPFHILRSRFKVANYLVESSATKKPSCREFSCKQITCREFSYKQITLYRDQLKKLPCRELSYKQFTLYRHQLKKLPCREFSCKETIM